MALFALVWAVLPLVLIIVLFSMLADIRRDLAAIRRKLEDETHVDDSQAGSAAKPGLRRRIDKGIRGSLG